MSISTSYAFLHGQADERLASLARMYLDLLLQGNRREASEIILNAVNQGASVKEIYLRVFQPVQYEVGRMWQLNKVSVAQEHFCTATAQMIMTQLFPYILHSVKNGLVMLGCCVGGELHELGIRMVSDFFEMEGWSTYYMGADMPDKDLLLAVRERNADLLCISATMAHNVPLVNRLIKRVRSDEQCRSTIILVGGFPFLADRELYASIGADGSAIDAQDAVNVAATLLRRDGERVA